MYILYKKQSAPVDRRSDALDSRRTDRDSLQVSKEDINALEARLTALILTVENTRKQAGLLFFFCLFPLRVFLEERLSYIVLCNTVLYVFQDLLKNYKKIQKQKKKQPVRLWMLKAMI